MTASSGRRFAPSVARNRDPILAVLREHLPAAGVVLEVASGTGEHAVHFAKHLAPELLIQPSDPDANARASIDAWVKDGGLPNLRPALALDASADAWPVTNASAVICINMIHISPWQSSIGLVKGAARLLPKDGVLILYGPYKRNGRHTAPSNEAFDHDLQSRNPEWGVRDLEAVTELATSQGFGAPVIVPMPANNFTLVFRLNSPTLVDR